MQDAENLSKRTRAKAAPGVRRQLWLSTSVVAVAAALVGCVPLLIAVAVRDAALLALGLPMLAVAVGVAIPVAGLVSRRAARPVEELVPLGNMNR